MLHKNNSVDNIYVRTYVNNLEYIENNYIKLHK
jgi:hypothetical protein